MGVITPARHTIIAGPTLLTFLDLEFFARSRLSGAITPILPCDYTGHVCDSPSFFLSLCLSLHQCHLDFLLGFVLAFLFCLHICSTVHSITLHGLRLHRCWTIVKGEWPRMVNILICAGILWIQNIIMLAFKARWTILLTSKIIGICFSWWWILDNNVRRPLLSVLLLEEDEDRKSCGCDDTWWVWR